MFRANASGVVAPLSNRVYLFNYFENVKLTEKEFYDFWLDAGLHIQTRDHFISTHLHQVAGSADTRFSWINFAVFDSDDVCCFGKYDPVWIEKMQSADHSKLTAYPGKYSEIASYKGETLTEERKHRSDESRFLVTAVVADESVPNEDLEGNWKNWMKADFIAEKLKGNNNWKDTHLYRMEKSRNPLVRYTVRTELSNLDEKEGSALVDAINQHADANGVQTFTGMYKVHTNMDYKKE